MHHEVFRRLRPERMLIATDDPVHVSNSSRTITEMPNEHKGKSMRRIERLPNSIREGCPLVSVKLGVLGHFLLQLL